MTLDDIRRRIEKLGPATRAEVREFALGTGDHIEAVVVSPAFQKLATMQRHRLVYDLFRAEMATGEIHALTLRTFAPDEASARA